MSLELGGWALGFVVLACLFSGFAHGAIGFGFPIVATPLIALVVDIKSAIALIAPITLVLVVISALRGGGVAGIVRDFWPVLAGAAVGAWLGTRLLIVAPPEPFILVLAIAILLYLNLDRLGRGTSPAVARRRGAFGLAFGFAGGVFEALANVAGPILLIYFMLLGLAPAQVVQTLNLCFSVGKGAQTLTLATSAAMTQGFWLLIGALALPSVAALFAGMRVRHRIDAATYRRWLRGALWVMALLLIGQFSGKAFASGEALFKAIESGDERAAERMVPSGSEDINARNAERETPLHRAVEKGLHSLARARRRPQRKGFERQPAAACGGRRRLSGTRAAPPAAHEGPGREEPRCISVAFKRQQKSVMHQRIRKDVQSVVGKARRKGTSLRPPFFFSELQLSEWTSESSSGTHVAGGKAIMSELRLKQEAFALAQASAGFVLVALVLTGIGGTIYKVIAPDGWVAQAFGRSLSAGVATLGSLIMIFGLAWFSRGWNSPSHRSRFSDLLVYSFAGAGLLYLTQLWIKGSF